MKISAFFFGLMVLASFSAYSGPRSSEITKVTPEIQAAYEAVLDLDESKAYAFIKRERAARPENGASAWAQAMVLAAKQLFFGDPTNRANHLEKMARCAEELHEKSNDGLALNMEAQVYLSIAAIRGHDEEWLLAGRAARAAYLCTKQAMKISPNAYETQINNGILKTLVGLVPEDYTWLTKLVGLSGSVSEGEKLCLASLAKDAKTDKPFALSAIALLVYRPLYQQEDYTLSLTRRAKWFVAQTSSIPLALSVHAALECHAYNSANQDVTKLAGVKSSTFICQAKATYYLGNLNGIKAEEAINQGLSSASKPNRTVLLWQRVLSRSLQGSSSSNVSASIAALDTSSKIFKAERLTISLLERREYITLQLIKARLATDAGNLEDALKFLASIQPTSLKSWQQADYYYRLGRAYEQKKEVIKATNAYQKSVALSSVTPGTYYSGYAAMRMGVINAKVQNKDNASKYFSIALKHVRNPYKATVESKANYWLNTFE